LDRCRYPCASRCRQERRGHFQTARTPQSAKVQQLASRRLGGSHLWRATTRRAPAYGAGLGGATRRALQLPEMTDSICLDTASKSVGFGTRAPFRNMVGVPSTATSSPSLSSASTVLAWVLSSRAFLNFATS